MPLDRLRGQSRTAGLLLPPGGLGAVTVEVTLNEDEFVAYTPGESDG